MNDQHRPTGLTLIEIVIWGFLLASIPLVMEVIRVRNLRPTIAWTGFVREKDGERVCILHPELLYYKDGRGQIVSISYLKTIKSTAVVYVVVLCAFFGFLSRRYAALRKSQLTSESDT